MLDSNRRLNWIRSPSSSSSSSNNQLLAKRKSKSMERLDKNTNNKMEKFMQKSIQQYEMKKNIVFKVTFYLL